MYNGTYWLFGGETGSCHTWHKPKDCERALVLKRRLAAGNKVLNTTIKSIFQLMLFGHRYTFYNKLISNIANTCTHGNTEDIQLTCSSMMVSLIS
jgi:hypothetical protein